MGFKYNNYIFDLDGTLINSSEEVIECMYKAFIKANYPIEKSTLTSDFIGPPLKQIIKNIAPELKDENKLNEILLNFRYFYDNDENDISKIYTGVYDVLNKLKNSGCSLFMATFKPTIPTYRIIKQFKLNYFKDIYTIDKVEKPITKTEMINDIIKKYKLNTNETVMIGDAQSDMIAAKEAGVKAIAALWGYGDDKTELIKNADYTIESINEVLCLK